MSLAGGNRGDVLASAREELTLWRIHPLVATSLFVLPFAGAAALAGLREGALFDFLIREDSLLEWLQVAGLCGAVLFAARIATSLGRVGEVPLAGAYGLLALGCALVLGEELSWGQRLLDLQAPERLAEINPRGGLDVHGVPAIRAPLRLVLVAIALYGSLLSVAVRLSRRPGRAVELLLPPVFLTGFFLAPLAYHGLRFGLDPGGFFGPERRRTLIGLGEWMEFCFALGLLAFLALGRRRLRSATIRPSRN